MFKRGMKKIKERKNERGLSTIVATLLIILLTLVAVGIIWIVVRNVLQGGSEQISLGKFTLDLKISQVRVINDSTSNITIKRNAGKGDFVGINFIFEDDINTETIKQNFSLQELETKSFQLIFSTINVSRLRKISIAPIYRLESGKEINGDIKDKYILSTSPKAEKCIPSCSLGAQCGSNGCGGNCGGGCTLPYVCSGTNCVNQSTCTDSCSSLEYNCGTQIVCGNNTNCGNCGTNYECSLGNCAALCNLTSAMWNMTSVIAGQLVRLNLTGTNCNGKTISFQIWEKNGWLNDDDAVTPVPSNITFNGTSSYALWNSVFQDDTDGGQSNPPEYYFVASVVGYSESIESSNSAVTDPLLLTAVQPITCGDGDCNSGETCLICMADCGSCSPVCGNSIIEGTEQCDGSQLGGATCASRLGTGYTGTLSCNSSCKYNTSLCVAPCVSTTCLAQGRNCGSISDNCGVTLNCGTCTLPQTCIDGVCTTTQTETWQTGMVSWWRFDGDALDSVGANHGTVNGANLISTGCLSGQCYSFDGVNDYISMGNPSNLNFTSQNFSFGGWIKHTSSSWANHEVPFGKGHPQAVTPYSLWIQNGIANVLIGAPGCSSWLTTQDVRSPSQLSTNTWHHIIITKNGINLTIFIDGIQVDSANMGLGAICSSSISFNIGGGFSGTFFNGSIDEVMVFNRSLSLTDIQEIYDYSCTPSCSGKVCGSDGCGGTCGSCPFGYSCSLGTCTSCTTHASSNCSGGDVYWWNSCGQRETIRYDCNSTQICSGGVCVNNPSPQTGNAIIANHNAARDFDIIPACWINRAKDMFLVTYHHTSHGSQIPSGMDYLRNYVNSSLYSYGNSVVSGSLYFMDNYDIDLGYGTWPTVTRNDLNNNPSLNNAMWSWCGQVGGYTTYSAMNSWYFTPAESIVTDFGIDFVYMTGHLDGGGPTGSVYTANNIIRQHVLDINGTLFDFADIESYDPDGNYYPNETDACNWCTTWCNAHPSDCVNLPSSCAHSHPFNCVQKAKAYWWMMARLAGWDGVSTTC